MEQVPGDILNHSSVPSEDCLGVDDLVLLWGRVDVPQANCVVVTGREEVSIEVGVPGETIAFLLMTSQPQVWLTLATRVRLAGMFRVVEHKHVTTWSLSGDDARVLRHVPGPVNLTLMVDLDLNFDLARHRAETTKLALLVVVVGGVKLSVLVRQLHAGDQ